MKKTYRNALRSKAMIRQSFLDLLREKPYEKITVADIIRRADLSRNTFYAHYQDVYAIVEEFGNELLCSMRNALDAAVASQQFDNPQPLFEQIVAQVDANRDNYHLLLHLKSTPALIDELRSLIIEYIIRYAQQLGIRDLQGYLLFLDVLISGAIQLFARSEENDGLSIKAISSELSRIYLAALPLYK